MGSIVFFEIEDWEKDYLKKVLKGKKLVFFEEKINFDLLYKIKDCEVLSVFIYSKVDRSVIEGLPKLKHVVTRSTGFDHIDVKYAEKKKIFVTNVPKYGMNTVAEHSLALLLALSRKIVLSVERTRNNDFSIDDLQGFDLNGKTCGVVGTGSIGQFFIKYVKALGMKVIAFDAFPNKKLSKELDFEYVKFNELLKSSDVISFHVPLTPKTTHMINSKNLKILKKGVVIINTSRGPVLDTSALVKGLEKKIIGGLGLDVLEEEKLVKEPLTIFHKKGSSQTLNILVENHQLLHHPKVIVTAHNAFNSKEAVMRILDTTVHNINCFYTGVCENLVK